MRRAELRAAVYIRVSTRDQRPGLQHDEVASTAKRRGWRIVHVYEEPAASGASKRLPTREAMMADAKRGRFELVLVYSLSRFARSLRDGVLLLADLDALGIDFVSCTEPFDSTTPSGRMQRGLLTVLAAYEREILIERTVAGVAAARARGAVVGRPRAWINVEQMRRLRDAGASRYAIARQLAISEATVRRALKRLDALPTTVGPLPVAKGPKSDARAPRRGAGNADRVATRGRDVAMPPAEPAE